MIISLRGTNGAGKSTIIRTLMKDFSDRVEIRYPGRRKPVGYQLSHGNVRLFVPGHYEIANGGIDTLSNIDEAYEMIINADKTGWNVIYEGKNLSDGVSRFQSLPTNDKLVIVLTHPVELCIHSVRERGHRIREETIRNIYEKTIRDVREFEKLGISVFNASREEALDLCRRMLFNGRSGL